MAVSAAGYQPEAIHAAQQKDPEIKMFYDFLKHETLPKHKRQATRVKRFVRENGFYIDEKTDIVYRTGGPNGRQLYVPECLRRELLEQFHNQPYAGHVGVFRTLGPLSRNYWWPGIRVHVHAHVRACEKCSMKNSSPRQRVRIRQQVEVPHIFKRVAMDFQGPFPASDPEGHTYVLNFLCLATGWLESVAIGASEKVDARMVAKLLVEHIILRFGAPRAILSDQDSKFVAAVVRETLKIFGVAQLTASAYNPQTDGKLERVHRALNGIVAKPVDSTHKRWVLPYKFAVWAYNTTPSAVYGDTPYFLLHGRDPTHPADVALTPQQRQPDEGWTDIADPEVRKWFLDWRAQLTRNTEHGRRRARSIQQELQSTMERESKGADTLPREHRVGEKVWVRDFTEVTGQELAGKWQFPYLPMPHRIIRQRGSRAFIRTATV